MTQDETQMKVFSGFTDDDSNLQPFSYAYPQQSAPNMSAGYLYYLPPNKRTEPFIFNEQIWQVMRFNEGMSSKIMRKIMEQLKALFSYYSKLLVIRIDFRSYMSTPNNKAMSSLMAKLTSRLKRRYRCNVGFVWVREQTEGNPHYHAALILNGHKVNHSARVVRLVEELLEHDTTMGFYLPKNCYYLIHRNSTESQQAAVYRLSYLAKNATKGNRPSQTKDYATSRYKTIV
ncbi:TPA: inovirus-type Gp2 protein [Vibrio vulnificus]|nr:inovirus-type Gp2 protein [Vibrio vulnificus]